MRTQTSVPGMWCIRPRASRPLSVTRLTRRYTRSQVAPRSWRQRNVTCIVASAVRVSPAAEPVSVPAPVSGATSGTAASTGVPSVRTRVQNRWTVAVSAWVRCAVIAAAVMQPDAPGEPVAGRGPVIAGPRR